MSALNRIPDPAIRHATSPAIRPLCHEFDSWRQRLLKTLIEMRAAGVAREILDAEIEATARALRILGGADA